jgi:multicomponent K+:H+ antiporter subunit G
MSALPLWAEWAIGLLAVTGGVFALIGAIGLVKLRDFYTRLHAPTKASTLGVGCALVASMLHFSLAGRHLVLHELAITLFLFVTAPVSAHLLAKAAMRRRGGERPPEPGAPTRRA